MAEQAGHEITTDADGADVVIVNTCAFIDRAKQESIDTILEMAEKKKATGAAPGGDRLPGRALPRRPAEGDPGDRRACSAPATSRTFSRRFSREPPPAGAAPMTFYRREPRLPGSGSHEPPGPEPPAQPRPCLRRGSAHISLRRRHAAPPLDPRPLRLREDRRGLRLQVRVLRDPEDARALPQPDRRVGGRRGRGRWPPAASRNCCSSRRTRPSTASTGRSATRCRGSSGRSTTSTGIEWVRLLYLYPTTITDATIDAIAASREGRALHRPAAAARVRPGAEAHEAARHARAVLRAAAATTSAPDARTSRCAPRSSSASRARPSRRRRGAARASSTPSDSTTSASSPTATRKTRRPSGWPTTCRRPRSRRRQRRVMAARSGSWRRARRRGSARGPAWSSTARRPSTSGC